MHTSALKALLIASATLLFAVPQASAEPAYSKAEVLDFLVSSADLGKARGICIGTAQECRKDDVKPRGFDMMINFNLDSAELTDEALENLNVFANALQDQRLNAATFVVEGHTDASGTEAHNDELASRRADSVKSFLLSSGVSPERLTAIGLGESQPRTDDPYSAENRRVEMRLKLQ
ncbi:OmpA family protein [Fulvimarina sp. MAC3]|uniref:OmpA family protein n=1 Tax=Fulvimarina sp. MAC3 TaxID=3148887 RepID=UPI0031FD74F2